MSAATLTTGDSPAALTRIALAAGGGDRSTAVASLQAVIDGPPRATPAEIVGLVGRLSLHYPRPQMTAAQNSLVGNDFISDLSDMTADEIAEACDAYRRNPANSYFPTPGKLIAGHAAIIALRKKAAKGARRLLDAISDQVKNQ